MASLEQQDVEGVRVLRLSGSLTQAGVEGIEPAFDAALPDGARAVVDLSGVDIIATPGIALIIAVSKRVRATQGRVVFAGARAGVLDILRRCKLNEVLELAGDRDDALRRAKA
jgi:anti-anti-sigma factor